jgi:hypothetical protein
MPSASCSTRGPTSIPPSSCSTTSCDACQGTSARRPRNEAPTQLDRRPLIDPTRNGHGQRETGHCYPYGRSCARSPVVCQPNGVPFCRDPEWALRCTNRGPVSKPTV